MATLSAPVERGRPADEPMKDPRDKIPPPPSLRACSVCGEPTQPNGRQCRYCGHPLLVVPELSLAPSRLVAVLQWVVVGIIALGVGLFLTRLM